MTITKKQRIFLFVLLIFIYILFFGIYNVKADEVNMSSSTFNLCTSYSGYYPDILDTSSCTSFSYNQLSIYKISDDYNSSGDFSYYRVTNYEGQANNRTKILVFDLGSDLSNYSTKNFVFSVYSRIKLPTGVTPYLSYYSTSWNTIAGNSCTITEAETSSDSPHYFYNVYCGLTGYENPKIRYFGINIPNTTDRLYSPIAFGISSLYRFSDSDAALDFYNGINQTTSNLNNQQVNDLYNSSIDSNGWGASISFWNSQNANNGVITNIITLPITLLQMIIQNASNNCTAINLGTLYNYTFRLHCIDLSYYLGENLWGIIDLILSGMLIYKLCKRFVVIFDDLTNLRDNQINDLYGGGR